MASITIQIPDVDVARTNAALAEALGIEGREATLDDLQAYIVQDVKQLLRNAEKAIASRNATKDITDVDVRFTPKAR